MKTNFLTRLAERTLGLTPVAQPVIAPMFASLPAIEGEATAQSMPGESSLAMLESDRGIAAQELGYSERGQEQAITQQAARTFLSRRRARGLPPGSLPSLSTSQRDDLRFAPQLGENLETATEQGHPLVNLQSSPSIPPMSPERDAHSAAITGEADVSTRDRRQFSAPTITSDQHIRPEERPGTASRSYSAAEALVPLPYRGQQRHALTAFEDTTSPSAADLPPAGGPTIRVTIGRIDVRAVMPAKEPAARPPTTRPAPALSLDDYLMQQSKGGQR